MRISRVVRSAIWAACLFLLLCSAWAIPQSDAQSVAPTTDAAAGFSKTKPENGPSVAVDGGFLIPYTLTIPGTDVHVEMVPVPETAAVIVGLQPNEKSLGSFGTNCQGWCSLAPEQNGKANSLRCTDLSSIAKLQAA